MRDYESMFVYGSLMRGQPSNDLLKDATFVGEAIVSPARLYDLGAFPALKLCSEGYRVKGEVWLVEPRHIELVDRLEGEGSLYRRTQTRAGVMVEEGFSFPMVWVYEYLGDTEGCDEIKSGRWRGPRSKRGTR